MTMLLLMTGSSWASHYAGAEFRIEWITGESYRITEKVYRDCQGIALGTTASANLVNLTSGGTQVLTLNRTAVNDITPLCPGQVSPCPSSVGVRGIEEHIYSFVVTLAAQQNYRIEATNNARNAAITTVNNAGAQSLYIYANFRTGIQNSSPTFLNRPIAQFCANQPATLSPNGFDPDGDNILYSLQTCFQGNGVSVNYNPGFTGLNPVTSSSGINLNPNTGVLTFTPTIVGQIAVICLRADEYRNGVVIGSVVRDMQINVLNCNNTPPVVAPVPNVVVNVGQNYCTPISATDINNNLITLTATSGIIPPATFVVNSSVAGSATGTFCFTPTLAMIGNTYSVTINAVDNACPSVGTGSMTFNITVPVPCNMTATGSGTNASCNGANGTATVAVTGGTAPITYSWNGPGGFTSFTQSNSGLIPGTYTVLVVDGNSCVANATVVVGNNPDAIAPVITCPASITLACPGVATYANATATDNCSGVTVVRTSGPASGSNFTNGTTSVTFTATDGSGNTAACSFNVTVSDLTPPSITCPASITQSCAGPVSFANATATDNCGNVTVAQTSGPASGSSFPTGTTGVSFTATDGSGNTAACSFSVSIQDLTPPVITCPASIIAPCPGPVTFANATATDNCGLAAVVQTSGPASGSTFSNGTTTISFSAVDGSGNTAACTFSVGVSDLTPPTINCGIFSGGAPNRTGHGGDSLGRASFNDNDNSVDTDPGACGALYEYDNEVADNCGGVTLVQTSGLPSGSVFPIGTTTNTFVVTDGSGNTASCSFDLTVTDNEAPVAVCQAITVSPASGTTVTVTPGQVATFSDNCGVATTAVTPNSFNCSQAGQTIPVVVTVTDVNGNSSTCTTTVTVDGSGCNQPPVPVCQNVTVNADGNCQGNATVGQFNGGSTDPNGDPLTYSVAPAGPYGLGVTNVVLSVSDGQFTVTCNATITVLDVTPPTIDCGIVSGGAPNRMGHLTGKAAIKAGLTGRIGNFTGTDANLDNDPGACGALFEYDNEALDNCGTVTIAQTTGLATGSVFPVGTTTNTFVATDGSGNTSSCTFDVNVSDVEAPVITCPAAISVSNEAELCSAHVSYTATATDNCPATSISYSPASGSVFAVGTTTVTATATDASGNSAACTFQVTVTDNEAPDADCQNLTVALDGNGFAHIAYNALDANSYDNCGVDTVFHSRCDFSCADLGNNTITLTVIDIHGNSSTCSGVVTVVDNEAPVAQCQDATVSLDANGFAHLDASAFDDNSYDNCSIDTVFHSMCDYSCANLGNNTVVLTVVDGSGNSSTCSANLTVLDNEAPTANCQNLTVSLNANGQASVTAAQVDDNSFDNCSIVSYAVNPSSFNCSNIGANAVTLTVTDGSGNTGTCSSTVTVVDNTAPHAVCQSVTVTAGSTGSVSITAGQVNNGSTDNCAIASLSVNPNSFSCSNAGPNTVVLTVTDVNGNVSTCSAVVTVVTAPIVVTLTSAVDACGYNVSTCCGVNGGGNGGSGSGSGSGSGHSEGHGSGSGSGSDAGSGSGHGSGHGNGHNNCNNRVCASYGMSNDVCGHGMDTDRRGRNNISNSCSHGSGTHGSCNHGNTHGGHGSNNGSLGHHGSGSGSGSCSHGSGSQGSCGHNGGGHSSCGHDGVANANASGGCAPYSFHWSNGANTASIVGLTPGVYTVTVTDGNGNTSVQSITLTQAAPLTVTATAVNVACYGSNNGSVTANGVGGCAPYTYHWSNNRTTQTITGLTPGSYCVTITDRNGCTANACATVAQPTRLVADAGAHQVVYPAYAPRACVTLTGTVTGGTPAYSTRWTNRQGVTLATGNSVNVCPTVTTVYYFRATDSRGCSSIDSVAVCPRNISCGAGRVQVCVRTSNRGCYRYETRCVLVSQVATLLSQGGTLGACNSSFNCSFPTRNNGNNSCKNCGDEGQATGDVVEAASLSLKAYPNPTNGSLTLDVQCRYCSDEGTYTVKVSDVYGKTYLTDQVGVALGEGSIKLDMSQFAAGVYMVTVENGDLRVVERVVKQ